MIFGRNKTALIRNTKEMIKRERIKQINSDLITAINSPTIFTGVI